MFTGYKGATKRLDAFDVANIAAEIEVGEDELHAFMDVESNGSGFDVKGRVKMLFEPHVFYRELGPGKKRDRAVKEGLAYAKWRSGGYPADSYPRLKAAMQIDELAALRSASWGLGQIMGFNCVSAGYVSPYLMVKSFADDEENQLRAMVKFIKAKPGLLAALKARDWAKVERLYNGGGFRGAYAAKMAAAFARWQKIKDFLPTYEPMPLIEPQALIGPSDGAAIGQIEPASTKPTVKGKPVLKHRRVWATITGYVSGGAATFFAMLQGFDWRGIAIMVGAAVALGMFFWLIYKREIEAGLFRPN